MTALRRRISLLLLVGMMVVVPVASYGIAQRNQRRRNAETRALIKAVLTNDDVTAIRLLDHGANPDAIVTKATQLPPTPGELLVYGQQRAMNQDLGPDPPPQIPLGPLLTSAIRNGDLKITMSLIAHGARVNVRDSIQSTPLGLALSYGQRPVVAALLAHGADANVREDGETPLFFCIGGSNQDLETIRLLLEHGADVNFQETGFHQTALMRVAGYPAYPKDVSQADAARLLLQFHPNLELRDMGGNTALRIAEKEGNTETAKLLRQAGAKEYSLFPPILLKKTAYKITDLGIGSATAINNVGDVVGMVSQGASDANGQALGQAFYWSHGKLQILGAFHGPSSIAYDINDKGQIVGEADFSQGDDPSTYTCHAFLWQNGVMQDLHPHTDGEPKDATFSSTAVAISTDGQVAESVNGYLFLWKNGEWKDLTDIHTSGNSGWDTASPVAMNNSSQVVLYLQASGTENAGLWDNGKARLLPPPVIEPQIIEGHKVNTIPNYHAEGINDKGEIVGQTDWGEPVLWSQGKVLLLPRLYHYGEFQFQMHAEHINSHDQIVGTVSDEINANHPEQHAVLWQNRQVVDLNAFLPAGLGWILEDATSINEIGQIVGYGTYKGKDHAFLLTPLDAVRESSGQRIAG